MIRVFFAALVLSMFLTAMPANAADWMHFMEKGNGDIIYIDMESIKFTSEHIAEVATSVESKETGEASVSKAGLDCKNNRLRILKTSDGSKDDKWREVDPAGMDELLLEFVCSLKKAR